MKSHTWFLVLPVVALLATVALTGCEKTPASKEGASANVAKVDPSDWCAEHGVPESDCTRCNPTLIAEFKQNGDWCKEHNLPESQCIQCDPSLKAKFDAMAPSE